LTKCTSHNHCVSSKLEIEKLPFIVRPTGTGTNPSKLPVVYYL